MNEIMATTQLRNDLKQKLCKLVCELVDEHVDVLKQEYLNKLDIEAEKLKAKRDQEVADAREKANERIEKNKEHIVLLKKEHTEEKELIMRFICKEYREQDSSLRKKLATEFGFCKKLLKNGKRCTRKVDNAGAERSDQYGFCKTCRPSIYYKEIQNREIKARIGDNLTEAIGCLDGTENVPDKQKIVIDRNIRPRGHVIAFADPYSCICDPFESTKPDCKNPTCVANLGTVRHTHPYPSGFVVGCPRCELDRNEEQKTKKIKDEVEEGKKGLEELGIEGLFPSLYS